MLSYGTSQAVVAERSGSSRPALDTLAPDTSTFEALLTPLLRPAYGVALHLARDPADAEDLVQEAALLAFRHFDSFQQGTNFKAWFFQIVVNCFRAKYRKEKRRPQTVDLDDTPDLYLYARTAETGLQGEPEDPAGALMARMDTEQVTAAIAALPEEYRMVSSLYFVQDFSYQEIAEVLHCPVGTVRSRLHRGRKMLQKALWRVAEERGVVRELTRERELA
jgi:RNA polymerase sigma-70 factor (ECF subfamily)